MESMMVFVLGVELKHMPELLLIIMQIMVNNNYIIC